MNIYADHAASSPMRESAKAVMLECLEECNPPSIHAAGRLAAARLERARKEMAELLNCRPSEIYFTSGGTEADNWAVCAAGRRTGQTVTSAFEHHAVLRALEALERAGGRTAVRIRPEADGVLDPEKVAAAADGSTALVSIMAANNEIGTIQPIAEIAKALKKGGRSPALFHTDAVQAFGQVPIDVEEMHIDMLSASAHKLNGPKGTGMLYIRSGLKIRSFIHGGAQEKGVRAGTENVPGIVGFAAAVRRALSRMEEKAGRERELRDYLIRRIEGEIPYCRLNGHREKRLPGNVNISFRFIEGESLLIMLDMRGVCASSGSACTSGSLDPSHVLLAIGLEHEEAHGSLRMTLSEENTQEELDEVVGHLAEIVQRLRDMSPLYEDFMKSRRDRT